AVRIRPHTPTAAHRSRRPRPSVGRSNSRWPPEARVHIVHATTDRSFALVERARGDGVDATAETCLHYLLLDAEELRRQGARAKINPPLRPRQEVERLWDLLRTGRIDFITTDHVGWSRDHKDVGSIFAATSGVPSLELFLPLLFHEAVHRRGLP